jgi:Predicted nucleotide-binding protein containing TIR-like domain
MSLPILTTAEDVTAVIGYLKTKPTGATPSEAKAVIDKTLLDPRKIGAYIIWGIIQKDGERLKLAPRGWDIARKTKPLANTFREVLDSIAPYRSALEWAHHQGFDQISNVDVAAQWHEHHSDHLGTDNENSIKDQAVCFLRIAEAAELGAFTLGRKGQVTRLTLSKDSLKQYIEAGPSAPPWVDPSAEHPSATEGEADLRQEVPPTPPPTQKQVVQTTDTPVELKVFISHGKNMELVEQIETMLSLADVKSEVAVKEEAPAIPVPDKVFNAMKKCQAAIIVVAVEEARKDVNGQYTINENVLIEIGAAFVLYDRRVVLLWDRRLPVPSNLQGLYRCEFEGDDLNWGAGMKLMKAIKGFKQ